MEEPYERTLISSENLPMEGGTLIISELINAQWRYLEK